MGATALTPALKLFKHALFQIQVDNKNIHLWKNNSMLQILRFS